MGNSQISHQYEVGQTFGEEFVLQQYGGKVKVDRANKLVMKDIEISAQEQNDFLLLLKQRASLHHPNLVEIVSYQKINHESTGFCSPSRVHYRIIYPLYVYSLFNQIQSICKLRKSLPQRQICRIFQELVSCLAYLNQKGACHGDIKVSSIFMDKQRNVKILDSFFLKQGKTSYQVVLQDPKSMSLLAPEQLQILKLKLYDNLQSMSQRQIFMVGMSMIQITTIQQGMKCYDLNQLKIRDQFFIYMMQHIQSCGYSFELSNLIMNSVHRVKQKRPNYMQFLHQIRNIRSRIEGSYMRR